MGDVIGFGRGNGEEKEGDDGSVEDTLRVWLHRETAEEMEEIKKQLAADEAAAKAAGLSVEQWKSVQGQNLFPISSAQWAYVRDGIERADGILACAIGFCRSRDYVPDAPMVYEEVRLALEAAREALARPGQIL